MIDEKMVILLFQSFLIIILELVCCRLFFDVFAERRNRKWYKDLLLFILFIVVDFAAVFFCAENFLVKQITVIIIYLIFMLLFFEIDIIKACFLSMIYQALLLVIDYLDYTLIKLFADKDIGKLLMFDHSELLAILGKAVLFICILVIRKQFGKKQADIIPNKVWYKLVSFSVVTIISLIAIK